MIKQVTMYTVECDSCKVTTADLGGTHDEDPLLAEMEATLMEWHFENGEHTCPNCWEYYFKENLAESI